MIQVDEFVPVMQKVKEALLNETQRVSILQKTLAFMKEVLGRDDLHAHQVRRPNIIILEAGDLLNPLMHKTRQDLLKDVEELRKRRQDHPRLP